MLISEQLKIIERNHIGHFVYLPQNLGFSIRKISDVIVIYCRLQTRMFNIAYGLSKLLYTSNYVDKIKQVFAGQLFAWWIPLDQHNQQITKLLLQNNLTVENIEHAMICNLKNVDNFVQRTNIYFKIVTNNSLLLNFISVLKLYHYYVQNFYEKLDNNLLQSDEKLVIGDANNKPVIIGILFINGNNAGIFSLIAKKEERSKGYGTEMMVYLINIAKNNNWHFATLSASSESGYRIYQNLRFNKVGEFGCFEYKEK